MCSSPVQTLEFGSSTSFLGLIGTFSITSCIQGHFVLYRAIGTALWPFHYTVPDIFLVLYTLSFRAVWGPWEACQPPLAGPGQLSRLTQPETPILGVADSHIRKNIHHFGN